MVRWWPTAAVAINLLPVVNHTLLYSKSSTLILISSFYLTAIIVFSMLAFSSGVLYFALSLGETKKQKKKQRKNQTDAFSYKRYKKAD